MEKELTKSIFLLKSLILHYHGLDDDERRILEELADEISGHEELNWANEFIAEDYLSAFERAKDYFAKTIKPLSSSERLRHLKEAWEDNHKKGYVTEMETTAMINLAKDWEIEVEFLEVIQD